MLRPPVDRKEYPHGLAAGSADLTDQPVEIARIGTLLSPATFDEIVPPIHFEGAIDLFSTCVSLKGPMDRKLVEVEQAIEEILEKIAASVGVIARHGMIKLA